MERKRIQWLDIAKGLAIILMILGHTSIPKFAADFIWLFHMPLFFIASGYTTNWGGVFSDFTAHKIKRLLLPFLCYSTIVLSIQIVLNLNTFSSFLRNGWQGYALWFIPVLFNALILSKLIMNIEHKSVQIAFWILMAIVGTSLSYTKMELPWTLSSVPYACFLIILGDKAKQYKEYISSPRWWILFGGFTVTVVVSSFYRLDMAWNKITPILILTIGACAGTAMIFTLASYIEKFTKFTSQVLQAIGKETYLILAFSQITIVLLNHYFALNSIIKYVILTVVLVALKYIKEGINKLKKIIFR